jgi:hypothetical protein
MINLLNGVFFAGDFSHFGNDLNVIFQLHFQAFAESQVGFRTEGEPKGIGQLVKSNIADVGDSFSNTSPAPNACFAFLDFSTLESAECLVGTLRYFFGFQLQLQTHLDVITQSIITFRDK